MRRRQAIRKLLAAMLCATLIISDLHIFAETKVFAAEPETVVTEDVAEETESLALENNDVSDGDSDAAVSAENMSSENSEENLQEENHAVGPEIEVYPQYSENSSSIVFQDGDIAHGTYEDITWVIDANGKLTVSGTGEFSASTNYKRAPWYKNSADIKSAEVNVSGMTNASYLFYSCSSLASIDLSGFDMSNVTDMRYMFYGCSSLTSIDLSGFDTSNVTDMRYMFYGCSSLTSIDLSGFDTSNVTDMRYMFFGCSSLTSIDVSVFDTSNVTNMRHMFGYCSGLTSIGMSGFDTSNVTDMSYMYNRCKGLTSINMSGWDTSNVKDMSYMYDGCSGLTSIKMSGWDTSKVTSMTGMFGYCSGLTSIDLSSLDTSKVTSMKWMFNYCSGLTSIDVSGFDTSNVTDMSEMFYNCSSLASIDLSRFDTSNVTEMRYMFYGCSSLTSINMSGWDTSNVMAMSGMFYYCSGLTSIDMSGFDTSNVMTMSYMFYGCRSLTSIDMCEWNTSNVTDMRDMFSYCSVLTSIDVSGFDTGKVTDMRYMFCGCSSLTSTDVSGFDTSNVTDMTEMFVGCSGLTSIDVSGFDTSNVTKMNTMFADCSGLTSIDVSGFDTSNVTSMSSMFNECRGLTSIDMSGWDTSKVTDMYNMFSECSGLTSIDMSGLDTSSVKDMRWMFSECRGLTSIDLSGLDTSNVTYMGGMFDECSGLTSIDVSGFDTSNVTDMSKMFSGCSGIKTIKTFPNLRLDLELPLSKMYDADGNMYEYFPTGLSEGITLYAKRGGESSTDPSEDPSEAESSSESESASESSASGESESSSATESSADNASESSSESEPSGELSDSTGLHVSFSEGRSFTYTGSAIKPVIVVTNNGEVLIEGIDYTVKYKNNTKAGTAKLTVTGKGSFTGKKETTFKIEQKSLNDDDIVANNITIAANSKASPVVLYNGMKLGAKDYTLSNPSKITEDTELVITGKGNYKDDVKIKVNVVEKAKLKKFKVDMKKENLIYNGTEQKLGFEVIDSNTKEPLKEDEYVAVYSEDATNAGTVKVTVIGQGMYGGSVTKSYKIAPLKAEDSNITVSGIKENYTFTSLGVTFNDETGRPSLQYKDTQNNIIEDLILDRDYKISYSANKKAGTAKYTINFIGNYKGTKPKKGTFTITPAVLDDDTVNVYVPDKVYTGKANAYKSVPIVTDKNGNVLKKSDYTVSYYADEDCTKEIKGKENLIELAEGQDFATVYVKVTGKGNYAGASTDSNITQQNAAAYGEYEVKRITASVLDLSKAKITFKQNGAKVGKLEYTGKPLTSDVEVSLKVKEVGTITLDSGQYDIQWTNNTNKGKAAVLITGNGQTAANSEYAFVGSKTATINITAKNIKNEQNLFGENTANFLKNLFASPKPVLNTY